MLNYWQGIRSSACRSSWNLDRAETFLCEFRYAASKMDAYRPGEWVMTTRAGVFVTTIGGSFWIRRCCS